MVNLPVSILSGTEELEDKQRPAEPTVLVNLLFHPCPVQKYRGMAAVNSPTLN